jgi:signal transduction histidine kinase
VNGPLTLAQLDSIRRIRSSGAHLTELVDEILDLAKVESQQLQLAILTAATADVVDRAVTLVRPQASARGIAIDMANSNGGRVLYRGDPRRVQQILSNLLTNAVKFTLSGGRITVAQGIGSRPDDVSGSGEAAYVSVADDGIGIAAADLERIFHPFVQLDSGYSRASGGAGLGLAISRGLAQSMGGALTVESATGVGSTFTLWLPTVVPATTEEGDDSLSVAAAASGDFEMRQASGSASGPV